MVEVMDEIGMVIAVLAAVVLAALLLAAFFVALVIELVLAMMLLIVGVVWRGLLRRPWTVEAVRQDPAPAGSLETIVVDAVVLHGQVPPGPASSSDRGTPTGASGHAGPGGSGRPPDGPTGHSGSGPAASEPSAPTELPPPDVVTPVDGEPDAAPHRLAWHVVGWRASGALRRAVAAHLNAFGVPT
jgi:hypothetical protein